MKTLIILLHSFFILSGPQEECAKIPSQMWNADLNRCVPRVDPRACDQYLDKAKRQECINQNAQGLSATHYQGDKVTGLVDSDRSNFNLAVPAAYALSYFISDRAKSTLSNSSCISMQFFQWTSIGALATDLFMKARYRQKLNNLRTKYLQTTTAQDHSAQAKSLDYIRAEQVVLKDVANAEKIRNAIISGGYLIAAGFALYELLVPLSSKPECQAANQSYLAERK